MAFIRIMSIALVGAVLVGCAPEKPVQAEEKPITIEEKQIEVVRNKGYPEELRLCFGNVDEYPGGQGLVSVPGHFELFSQYLETMTEEDRLRTRMVLVVGSGMDSIAGIELLPNLEEIQLDDTFLRDLSPLGKCRNARIINVKEARAFVLPDFSACENLETLWLIAAFKDISNIYTINSKDLVICLWANDETIVEQNMGIVKDYMKKTGKKVGVMKTIVYYE